LRKGVIIDRPIAAAYQSWQGCNSDLADGSTDWVAISEEAEVVKRRRASVVRRSCRGGGVAIGDRDEKWREIEGRWKGEWSTGEGGRVYIVVQAARGRHTRMICAKPFSVIHRSPTQVQSL
jgi:hypothetical protein